MNSFLLQAAKETLNYGIVPAVTFTAHAALDAMSFEQLPEGFTGILAAPVRVMDQAPLGSPLPNRHL